MLEELDRDVLERPVVQGQPHRHGEQIQRVHRHPRRGVGLLEVSHVGRDTRAIDRGDVVQSHEAALEQVVVPVILVVRPPGEVDQQFVKDPGQEAVVRAAVEVEDPQRGPSVHRRVYVGEVPLVRRNLAVGM
jgi:hypothetical protein